MILSVSAPLLHFDEPEFTKFIKTIIENSASTFETSARIAKSNGGLFSRCFSCTPGDLDTDSGQEAAELLKQTCKWTEKMYDMGYDPDEEKSQVMQYVLTNSTNRIVYIEYSYKQLGLTDAWARKMYDLIGNPTTYKREILLQRLRGSSDSPFDRDDLDYLTSVKREPIDEIILLDNYIVYVYEPLDKSIPYIVGIDCATGTNGDSNAITIINPYTECPAAEFSCNYIGDVLYEKFIIELVKKVIPKAIVVIERNHVGQSVIGHLLVSPISNRLYFDKNKDLVEEEIKNLTNTESILKKKAEAKRYYGVYTEGNSRDTMINILMNRMANYKNKFVTKNIIDDIFNLVRFKSGKIAARDGAHDDSIMSYLIAMYVYYHGNNLMVFGFTPGAEYTEEKNKGIDHIEDLVTSDVIDQHSKQVLREQLKVQQENAYEDILRRALSQAQSESTKLHKRGLVDQSEVADDLDTIVDEYDTDAFDEDLFDTLNGFDSGPVNKRFPF